MDIKVYNTSVNSTTREIAVYPFPNSARITTKNYDFGFGIVPLSRNWIKSIRHKCYAEDCDNRTWIHYRFFIFVVTWKLS